MPFSIKIKSVTPDTDNSSKTGANGSCYGIEVDPICHPSTKYSNASCVVLLKQYCSTDVLRWICGKDKDFQTFVANRVGEIKTESDPPQWQHAQTEEDPADLCTGEQVLAID